MTARYTSRLFQNEADYKLMQQLLIQTYPLESLPLNLHVGELDWWRATTNDPDVMHKVRLWFDELGTLVAFVWPGSDQVDVMIHPDHRDLEQQILLLAEAEFLQSLESQDTLNDERSFHYFS
jgi:hypothetical protein